MSHRFGFLADKSLKTRADRLLKKASYRAIVPTQADLLRFALVEYLDRHEKEHEHSPPAPAGRTPRAPGIKKYTLGPNAKSPT